MKRSNSSRPQKVGDLIHRTVAEMLLREVKDPRLSKVTITEVEVSGDLAYAKIYFSVLGDEKIILEAQNGFEKCKGWVS